MVASGAVLLLSVSTGNKLGLGLIGLAVVVFALVASMVIPRRSPDFPGRHLGGFLLLSVCFFAAMLFAVFFFGKETHAGNEALGETPTTTVEQGEGVDTSTGVTAPSPTTSTTATATETGAGTTTETETGSSGPGGGADLAAGRDVFVQNCAACHTLQDAKTSGTVGPNLDQLQPDEETVERQVENGGGGMPAFKGVLTSDQIKDVAAYVASAAGSS